MDIRWIEGAKYADHRASAELRGQKHQVEAKSYLLRKPTRPILAGRSARALEKFQPQSSKPLRLENKSDVHGWLETARGK